MKDITRNLAIQKTIDGSEYHLGLSVADCPASYPLRPFYVQLPSGLRHWFESEMHARHSRYWMQSTHQPQQPGLNGLEETQYDRKKRMGL